MTRAALMLTLLLPALVSASEVDSYTGHPQSLADAAPRVDELMNGSLALGVRKANRRARAMGRCDDEVLYRKLIRQFVGGPGGFIVASRIERRIIHDDRMDQIETRLKDSIYHDYGVNKLPTMVGGGLASVFAFDDHVIGTDKIGHFVAVGWTYFVRIDRKDATLAEVLELGMAQEKGLFGEATTGVLSYADLSANYNGLLFWQRMITAGDEDRPEPFVACVADGTRWEVRNPIHMADYVDATWDERLNPSEYLTPELAKRANANMNDVFMANPAYPQPRLSLLEEVHPATNAKYKDLPRALAPIAPSLVYP